MHCYSLNENIYILYPLSNSSSLLKSWLEFLFLFSPAPSEGEKEVQRLKRRFMKDQSSQSAFFAKRATRQKQLREVELLLFSLYLFLLFVDSYRRISYLIFKILFSHLSIPVSLPCLFYYNTPNLKLWKSLKCYCWCLLMIFELVNVLCLAHDSCFHEKEFLLNFLFMYFFLFGQFVNFCCLRISISLWLWNFVIMNFFQEVQKSQRERRFAQVTMYRQYRTGDLPDIQIKHSDIIAPLQALALVGI